MNFSIAFTEQEFNILSVALVELSLKVVAPLVAKINQQNAGQQRPAPAEKPEPAEQSS